MIAIVPFTPATVVPVPQEAIGSGALKVKEANEAAPAAVMVPLHEKGP